MNKGAGSVWDMEGLQNLTERFDSAPRLQQAYEIMKEATAGLEAFDERTEHPAVKLYHLLKAEALDHEYTKRRVVQWRAEYVAVSKELSKIKRNNK